MRYSMLFLPGWGNPVAEHWVPDTHNRLLAAGEDSHLVQFPEPAAPNWQLWLATLDEAVQDLPAAKPVIVFAHSLGAITWLLYVDKLDRRVADTVYLVAPPYVSPQLAPRYAPNEAKEFFPVPLSPDAVRQSARETNLVWSRNDCFATADQTGAYIDALGSSINSYEIEDGEHFGPKAGGYVTWPWVYHRCRGSLDSDVQTPQDRHWSPPRDG